MSLTEIVFTTVIKNDYAKLMNEPTGLESNWAVQY